jgi:hypothetical protein
MKKAGSRRKRGQTGKETQGFLEEIGERINSPPAWDFLLMFKGASPKNQQLRSNCAKKRQS